MLNSQRNTNDGFLPQFEREHDLRSCTPGLCNESEPWRSLGKDETIGTMTFLTRFRPTATIKALTRTSIGSSS
jgi:hypothetical protein